MAPADIGGSSPAAVSGGVFRRRISRQRVSRRRIQLGRRRPHALVQRAANQRRPLPLQRRSTSWSNYSASIRHGRTIAVRRSSECNVRTRTPGPHPGPGPHPILARILGLDRIPTGITGIGTTIGTTLGTIGRPAGGRRVSWTGLAFDAACAPWSWGYWPYDNPVLRRARRGRRGVDRLLAADRVGRAGRRRCRIPRRPRTRQPNCSTPRTTPFCKATMPLRCRNATRPSPCNPTTPSCTSSAGWRCSPFTATTKRRGRSTPCCRPGPAGIGPR